MTEETAELVTQVVALDIGKAPLVACVLVPHEAPAARLPGMSHCHAVTRGQLPLP
jgi:hypothetical protein